MDSAADLSQLKGIMPDTEIPVEILPCLLIVTALLLISALGLWRYLGRSKKPSLTAQDKALHRLRALLDHDHLSRETLFRFSIDTQCYLNGKKDIHFEELQDVLLPYKYQAEAPPPDTDTIQKIHRYIRGLS